MVDEFSMEQPGGKRCAYGAQAAYLKQHMTLVAKGAHIAMQRLAARDPTAACAALAIDAIELKTDRNYTI